MIIYLSSILLCIGAWELCPIVLMENPEANFQELILSLCLVGPGDELRWSALETSTLAHQAICPDQQLILAELKLFTKERIPGTALI